MEKYIAEKYVRQIMLFGEEGQKKLRKAKIFVAGAGGLGSPISTYLAIAGIGKIILADFDSVELSNLNRQFLHHEKDVGREKIKSAEEKLLSLNPEIKIETIRERITEENADSVVPSCDLIIDALDNFDTRHVLNRLAVERNIPLVHGAVSGYRGQVTTVIPGKTPCLYCIFPTSLKKEVFPVLGTTPGVIGTIQANEAIKYITGQGKLLEGRLLLWDGLSCSFSELKINKTENCPICRANKEL
ncbi:adenylyltransferase and sulfurtransferase [Methanosarcina thermophila]|jgi:molybdopterin/thiamine biosynthesis adenylyltransferase|uniref:4-methyl-5-(Beta-hydroxyethyl)thiazole monophosphate synthesis protein ThiF n=3 Tax=Methanosarcina thermophila TaxID=2210 RepID=A0A1I7BCR9_METTE|nr:HesA/MoeB/ThiF family protein [Methanosarcina thermophila]AKB12566.1 Dinucleotide-utilizing enzymes involved in molybdopterin and thiamine biosynthesis family 2 [Methanosarcina thermophila TM-1]AKB16779.1 Dinucleotide-utilizing enzymes involved in molybdopterin and thiamine biosynthesis family 2 [Methanosarcina thermophila CHTI-55]NLU58158.1 HesA/MoeB/ThiF family protein [Methanosarcina thermophila]SFT84975.1 adenylyltransferase and sulfurtransferase [Methanosarcina thermophila]BAW30281.1 4